MENTFDLGIEMSPELKEYKRRNEKMDAGDCGRCFGTGGNNAECKLCEGTGKIECQHTETVRVNDGPADTKVMCLECGNESK